MILGTVSHAADYQGISPALDRALALLTPAYLDTVGPVADHIDGDRLFATRNVFDTVPEEECFFESHRRYLDIHVPVGGEERVDLALPDELEPIGELCAPERDFYAFRGELRQTVILRPGDFLVVWPADAHRVRMQVDGPCTVAKVVFKVLLGE